KVLISGGGYGQNLGLEAGNSGLSEGGLLSTSCLMAIPLAIFLASHSQLLPKFKLMSLAYWGIAGLALATAIGTYERSALVGLIVLGLYMWTRTKHKIGFGIVVIITACLVIFTTSHAWNARVDTITNFEQENSAYVRILVWKWTLGFVADHPLGGGFASYLVNHIEIPATSTSAGAVEFGRAFHSIYFEVLGEHGYPGLFIFLLLAGSTLLMLRRLTKKARPYPELKWVIGLSDALQSGLAVFLTSGAFVGIAFQPMFWYFISMSICLNAYVWRVERADAQVVTGWRAMAMAPVRHFPPVAEVPGWRQRAASTQSPDAPLG
ncbi:MAG TPA: O-antigen ligase family protein, partial [Acetobacteraceae bacterium]|nr:O-antigen ligase family protein [Acetobacteraceae bacterium]